MADLLVERPPDTGSNPELIDLLERRQRLRHELDRRFSSLMAGSENPVAEIRQRGPTLAAHDSYQTHELSGIRQQIQTLEEQIARQRDAACDWREGVTIEPRYVHRLLDEQTILISYYTAGGRLHALTATHIEGDLRIHALHVSADEVEERWWQTRRMVTRPASRIPAVQARLAFMWKSLIAPLEDRLHGKTRLLILPHRGLFHVPFAGLYDAESGQYLVERWTVQLSPSATVLERCRRRARATLRPLLVGYPGHPDQSDYLPGVEREIQTLSSLFSDAAILLDGQATMHNVMSALPQSSLVHLAGHAFYDSANPLESGMPLAGGDWLRAADLYLQYGRLGGSMVVLSGCNAGRGRPTGGDVLGLTSAFLYAGAVGIVASLWRVDDVATTQLMAEFYGGLAHGADTAHALRLAQLGLLHSKPYAHPYFWASFGLSGDSCVLRQEQPGTGRGTEPTPMAHLPGDWSPAL